jgi:Skp family chaperone for outer membrane proteins
MILVVTGLAVVLTGAYCSTYLFAQGGGAGATPQVQGTKVAVVNIGHVFNKYKKAVQFKDELERNLKGPREEAKKLMSDMDDWAKQLRDIKLSTEEKNAREIAIHKNKQRLEALNFEISKLLGKKSEDNLVLLYKEVNQCIERVSVAYGFQVVLGYGDPIEKGIMDLFPNINRKMQAMDAGGTVPLYIHGSVDLSTAVADTLNHWYDEHMKKQGLLPAGGAIPK